jgi:hypothetical protein
MVMFVMSSVTDARDVGAILSKVIIEVITTTKHGRAFYFCQKKPKKKEASEEFSHPYTRIWTAVDRRLKTVAFKIGDGNKSNFIELAMVIEQTCGKIKYLCTDEYKAYCSYKLTQFNKLTSVTSFLSKRPLTCLFLMVYPSNSNKVKLS